MGKKKKFDSKGAMDVFAERVWKALEESEKDKKLAWVKPWREIDCAYRNAFSKHEYSGLHNILTCALSDFSDPRYMTFNQARKNGGKVKAGEKATYLLAWKFSKMKVEKDDGTTEVKVVPFAKKVPVFNAEQTEGIELPPIDTEVFDEEMEANEQILEMFKTLGITVKHKKSNRAFYDPSNDSITIPNVKQFKDADEWSGTCLHEMVHWTASRVDRDCSKYGFDTEERAMEELVAELGSMFLSMKLKVNGQTDENSLAYLSSWKKAAKGKNGKRFVYKACRLAEKACKHILEQCGMVEEKKEEEEAVTA